jgi:hypothetical protein
MKLQKILSLNPDLLNLDIKICKAELSKLKITGKTRTFKFWLLQRKIANLYQKRRDYWLAKRGEINAD